MTTSTANPGSKVGRARRRLSQLWQVPAFLVGLLALISVAASAPWRHPPQWWEFDAHLARLRDGLLHNEPDDQLVNEAEIIDGKLPRFPDRADEAHFLIGSVYYRQARHMPAVIAQEIWPRAAEHLDKANGLGDADRLAQQYRLGYCLYQQKKEIARAIEMMMLSLDKSGEAPLDGYRLLVEANLARTPPNLEAALAANQRVLDLTPERDIEALALARLQHGELLLRKPARADAFKALERIDPKAPRSLRIKARLLQSRACEEDGLWQKAITIWQELLKDAPHVEGKQARIYYAMGWCYHQLEPPNHAETMRVWSESLKLGGAEGQAAGLRLGELRLSMGQKEAAAALADWKQALAHVNGPKDFKNPYLKLTEVCELFDHAFKQFQEWQDPEKTQDVAELYRKLAPSGEADKRLAEAAEKYADQLRDKRQGDGSALTAQEVESQYRLAGALHEFAARALPEAERPEALWHSAMCYLAAKALPKAQQALNEHVKIGKDEMRLAEAWFTLGDLYRAEGKKYESRMAFLKCKEIPNTKFAYRSNYFLALDEIDKKNYEQARAILQDNLGASGNVDRPSQEKSQYKMAWLLMQLGKYDEAHVYLKECKRLYPENPNVLLAQEQLGECYRKLAKKEQQTEREVLEQIKPDAPPERRLALEDTARQHKRARVAWLSNAVRAYEELSDELKKQQVRTKTPLSPRDEELLRRARFGVGECHLDNEEFPAAMDAFKSLQGDHRRTLESFYSCLRLCNIVEVMQVRQLPKAQVEEAQKTALESLRQFGEDLKALPENHETFHRTGVRLPTRDEWLRWRDATEIRLLAPPKNERALPFIQ